MNRGPMGIFEDFDGCDSGINTEPTSIKKLSDSMTVHQLRDEAANMTQDLLSGITFDEYQSQKHDTQDAVYAAAEAKARPVYLQILEILAKAHGYDSYEGVLEAKAISEAERADEKFYGGM